MNDFLSASAVRGGPRLILRIEGLSIFVLATVAYFYLGFSTTGYFVFFLAPDVAFLAYLAGPAVGAVAYNALHSYAGAVLLGAMAWQSGDEPWIGVALIWAAHIGFDRLLGYGLKYAASFQHTHLGHLGPRSKASPA